MEAGIDTRRSSSAAGAITAGLVALAAAALLVTFLFTTVVDYTETIDPDVVSAYGFDDDVIDVSYKGKDMSDEAGGDGAALLVWTIAAGGLALILGLVGLIPAVSRHVWAVAVPAALVLAAWAIYSRVWFNEQYDHLDRLGPGGKVSFYAAIAGVVVAIAGSIVTAVRNRGTA
jgi:hypothetical protein